MPQLLACLPERMLRKRSHSNEKPAHLNAQREKACIRPGRPRTTTNINQQILKKNQMHSELKKKKAAPLMKIIGNKQ